MGYHYSFDQGLNWYDGSQLSGTFSSSIGDSAESTTAEGNVLYQMQRINRSNVEWLPYALGQTSSEAYDDLDLIIFEPTYHPTAIAQGDGVQMAVSFVDETADNNSKRLFWARSEHDGTHWPDVYPAVTNSGVPVRTGIRTAVAPRLACGDSNVVQNCVLAWTSITGKLLINYLRK